MTFNPPTAASSPSIPVTPPIRRASTTKPERERRSEEVGQLSGLQVHESAMVRTTAAESSKRSPNDLLPNPKQAVYFSPPSAVEIERLAADIEANGLKIPVSILPDGTIISGHSRVAAAKLLKMQTIDVVVRHDLVEDAIAAERELVSDNHNRRHMSPLERARCIQFLVDSSNQELSVSERQREIGRQLDLGERSVRRYLSVLNLPRYFQTQFEQEKLRTQDVAKILRHSAQKQAELAAKAEGGESISNLLKGRGTQKRRKPDAALALRTLISALNEANTLLDQLTVATMKDLSRSDRKALEEGKMTLDRLLSPRDELTHSVGKNAIESSDTVSKFPAAFSRGGKKKPPAK